MSETEKDQRTQSGETDWGRKLREFMERQAQADKKPEQPKPKTAEPRDKSQDELDALLIEQLNRQAASRAAAVSVPDSRPAPQPPEPEDDDADLDDGFDDLVEDDEDEEISGDLPEEDDDIDAVSEGSAPADAETAAASVSDPVSLPVPPIAVPDNTGASDREIDIEEAVAELERLRGSEVLRPAVTSTVKAEEPDTTDEPDEEEDADDSPAASVPGPRHPARDDVLNGISVAEMLNSGEFLENLDPETRAGIKAIWERGTDLPADEDIPAILPDLSDDGDDEAIRLPGTDGSVTPGSDPQPPVQEQAPAKKGTEASARRETAGTDPTFEDVPIKPIRRSGTTSSFKSRPQAADPMQISLNSTFRLMDEGLFPEEERRTDTPAAPDEPAPASKNRPKVTESGTASETEDTALFVNLGYENELRRTAAGSDRADRLQNQIAVDQPVGTRNTLPAAYRGKEYAGRSMTDGVEKTYKISRALGLCRLAASLAGAVIVLLFDLLPLIKNYGFIRTPWYPLAELTVTSLFCLPCLRRMILGLRGLWDFEPVRFSVPALSLVFVSIYELIAVFAIKSCAMPLFGCVVLVLLTLACITDDAALLAQRRSFRIVSSGKARFVLTTMTRSGGERTGDDYDRTLRVCRTNRLLDFFVRAEKYNSRLTALNYLIPAALLMSILVCGLGIVLGTQTHDSTASVLLSVGLPLFIGTFLSCMPGAFILSLSLPLYAANRALAAHGCAVIGEAAPEQYVPDKADASVRLIIPDGQAMHVSDVREITDKNDPDTARWTLLAHKLFSLMDCSLRTVGEPVRREDLAALRTELTGAGDGYVALHMTDSRTGETVEVTAGSWDALHRQGVNMPKMGSPEHLRKSASESLLYLVFDRRVRMVVAFTHKPDALLTQAARTLRDGGCQAALMSYDPTLTRPVLEQLAAGELELIRPRRYSELYAPRSGSMVATRSGLDLGRTWLAASMMQKSYKRSRFLAWAFCAAAWLIAVLCCLTAADMIVLPIAAFVWQVLTGAASSVLTFLTINKRTVGLTDTERNPD
ncbi:MAG: hypothetical protein MJ192_03005 [Clostridia bacterium]|nr:hypothetical protein [Clostridia bacterium]